MVASLGSGPSDIVVADIELDFFSFAAPECRMREVSEAFAFLLGGTPGELNGRRLRDVLHPDDRSVVLARLAGLNHSAGEVLIECRFVQNDGRTLYLPWVARPMAANQAWRAAGTDTADLVKLLAERRDLRTRLDLAIGQATAAMWDLSAVEARFDWEPQAAEILGVSVENLPGTAAALAASVHPDDSEVVTSALDQLLLEGATEVGLRVGEEAGIRHLSLRGRILDRDQYGQPLRAVGLLLDITTEKAMEEQLLRMTVSDALTGAPNRRAFDQALRGEWRRCTRARTALSIVMLDIDRFKQFNDTFGHLIGDQALTTMFRALAATLHREGDVLARYGGEEFALVLPGCNRDGASAVAQRLLMAAREVVLRQAPDWNLSVSVGTASWHADHELIDAATLLGRADEALYAAKATGRNRVIAYEESLAARGTLQADIARGLQQHEFELYYQPLIDVADGQVTGFEALMRWNRPGYGLVAPDAFIPVAESTTLICELGRWALQDAACQLAAWSRDGVDGADTLRVAVNVSARHAAGPEIVADVGSALAAAGLAPDRLEVELTETALRSDVGTGTHLNQLRTLGVTVAIDDFGTGYTSIGELAHLPVDVLKIDRSFTKATNPREQTLVKLMIEAAHAFDLRVVAEGVENTETLEELRDLNCDSAQGYLIARPMPAHQVLPWLETHAKCPTADRPAAHAPAHELL